MVTAAVAAFGVVVSVGGVPVAEVLNVPEMSFKKAFKDVTNHDSPGGYEESIVSKIIRSEEVTTECNSINGNAGQIAVKAQQALGTAAVVTFAFPDGTVISGNALVTGYSYLGAMEDQIIFKMTTKWTGAVTDTVTLATAPSALAVTTAALFPDPFAAAVYEYFGVSTADTCTITLTFLTATAKLYREGIFVQNLVTATPSGSISLGVDGTVTDLQVVVTETGKGTRTYNLHISNAAS